MTTVAQKIDQLIVQQQNFQKSLKKLASNVATKQDVVNLKEELVEKISHLPTKEEYYTTMDKWMKATSTHELENSAHQNAHKRIEDHLNFSHVL
ncbi:hypothetical protein COU89_02730 [Candidatus Roizmanbacteria bacterium CG10_big_fil_rev_8_21_14_0_10_45_7]|uniref:Uncharacterized protein n=1 Tax=Candidatus Roizmanbacteria bacterium CG10_big_fil_rev_8_21_14_0_10_45_7 TaxID=1974854 RepID=A0A2M8KUI7_9BACT|nr:MAG: hypothetical protein COU89_02730 [Candidatus Roizmanbacteria bacterium CG10_big_fil_rev_8_21_14_0_10_45_7]